MNISLLSLHLMRLSIQKLDTKRLDIYKPANSIEKNTEMMGEYTSVAPAIGAPQPASRIDNQTLNFKPSATSLFDRISSAPY